MMGCCGQARTPIASAISGAVKIAKAELGIGRIRDEVVAERRAICEGCERWDHGRCTECGCFTYAKTKLRSEACPLGKWSRVDA